MTARLAASVFAQALLRRVAAAGGVGTIIAKGDATAGSTILSYCERGEVISIVERLLSPDGEYRWSPVGPKLPEDAALVNDYLGRRRRADPDLWIIELDIVGVERLAAEIASIG